ncbi:MAG TPA: protein-L-isoaspartate(D-aspartate) O-methyltransferase [Casimicrobiaceae bacterium]
MVRGQIAGRGVKDEEILAAMVRVPRHAFVPADQQRHAYADRPLPIGHGQTISQPYIVAYMTELLRLARGDRVLEVGAGSGYQAAILAELADAVVTIEIVRPLAEAAAKRLERLGYRNVTVLHGDGYFGWESAAPYDAIIVTAAASHVPPPLIAQLKPGGRMAIPVGDAAWTQNLLLVEKDATGTITTRNLLPVRFVPLTRGR